MRLLHSIPSLWNVPIADLIDSGAISNVWQSYKPHSPLTTGLHRFPLMQRRKSKLQSPWFGISQLVFYSIWIAQFIGVNDASFSLFEASKPPFFRSPALSNFRCGIKIARQPGAREFERKCICARRFLMELQPLSIVSRRELEISNNPPKNPSKTSVN